MQTAILSNDFALTGALRSFIGAQIRRTMRSSTRHVESLTIRLKDLNGPKGGDDKECCVEVKLSEQATVVVIERNADAYAGIRTALARASRTTLRRLQKKRRDKRKLRTLSLDIRQAENLRSGDAALQLASVNHSQHINNRGS